MTRYSAFVALCSLASVGNLGHASVSGQQAPSTSLARLNVMVEDSDGRAVTNLARDDFEIWSDGQRREVDAFSAGSNMAPLRLVALVDITASQYTCPCCVVLQAPTMSISGRTGGSMSSTRIGNALGGFALRGLRPEDRVRVGSVGRRTVLSRAFQGDAKEVTATWRSLFEVPPVEWLGPSPIWDAIYEAVGALAHESGRRAILVVTDGQASGNERGVLEVAGAASIAGVSVNVVALESMLPTLPLTSMASHGVDPTVALRRLSDFTGGAFSLDRAQFGGADPCFSRNPGPHFSRILEKLRLAYELRFTPQLVDDKPHSLEVRVKKPGATARVRKAYVAGQGVPW